MDEPVPPLDQGLIEGGERLVRKIEEAGGQVPGALWVFNPDVIEWRLFLALPEVDLHGPAAGAELVSQAIALLRADGDNVMTRSMVSCVGVRHALIWQFASAVGTGADMQRLRIQRMRINGHMIEDVLIYRLHKPSLTVPEKAA